MVVVYAPEDYKYFMILGKGPPHRNYRLVTYNNRNAHGDNVECYLYQKLRVECNFIVIRRFYTKKVKTVGGGYFRRHSPSTGGDRFHSPARWANGSRHGTAVTGKDRKRSAARRYRPERFAGYCRIGAPRRRDQSYGTRTSLLVHPPRQ